jgi:hypothetical protein
MSSPRKVLLIKEGVYADLITEGAYASRVRYTYGGVLYDVLIENEEFEIIEESEWSEEELSVILAIKQKTNYIQRSLKY